MIETIFSVLFAAFIFIGCGLIFWMFKGPVGRAERLEKQRRTLAEECFRLAAGEGWNNINRARAYANWPDTMVLFLRPGGKVAFALIKNRLGTLTRHEDATMRDLRARGYSMTVVRSLDEARSFLAGLTEGSE